LFGALLSDAALRQVEGDTGASDRLCAVAAQLRKLALAQRRPRIQQQRAGAC
jgi:hypothetical protein